MRSVRVNILQLKSNEYYSFRKCLFTALLIQDTMRIRHIVICGLTVPTLIFPHFLTNCTTLDKMLREVKYVLWFSLQSLSEIFAILTSSERNVIKNAHLSSTKVPVILVRLLWILNSLDGVSKNKQILNFKKIVSVETQLVHADRPTLGRTDWWTDGQSYQNRNRLSQFYKHA